MLPAPVFIVSAARTPIGKYGGAFRDVHPAELGAVAARAAAAADWQLCRAQGAVAVIP